METNIENTAAPSVEVPRLVRQGWRGFVCECGQSWKTPTRDHKSPSVDTCPACYADTAPCDGWHDATLIADAMGNLMTAEHAYDWKPNSGVSIPPTASNP